MPSTGKKPWPIHLVSLTAIQNLSTPGLQLKTTASMWPWSHNDTWIYLIFQRSQLHKQTNSVWLHSSIVYAYVI